MAYVEKGNAIPGILKDESLEKQASRIGFSSSMSMLPPNSVSSSMGTHLDPNVTVNYELILPQVFARCIRLLLVVHFNRLRLRDLEAMTEVVALEL
ncbi:hypothetical protein CK203_090056 [Vitis vinifera]|uniref:Uncharacterized protein n=1 Tax=Vitis vinifera TaxID=29760 RepID=A0A438DY41_VITVI|nr:hypothetical protein CK203_090056 [Vitis vinifera]